MDFVISWFIFIEELIAHYGDININTFFSQLVNLSQKCSITNHIKQLQKLSVWVKNVSEDNLLDLLMGILEESIQHELCLFEPKPLEQDFSLDRKVESKNMTTRK